MASLNLPSLWNSSRESFSLGNSDLFPWKAGFPRNSWGRAYASCK